MLDKSTYRNSCFDRFSCFAITCMRADGTSSSQHDSSLHSTAAKTSSSVSNVCFSPPRVAAGSHFKRARNSNLDRSSNCERHEDRDREARRDVRNVSDASCGKRRWCTCSRGWSLGNRPQTEASQHRSSLLATLRVSRW